MARDATYDVAHYHLHNGWAWWNARLERDAAPADLHSFLNPAWQILIWPMVEHLPGRLIAFLVGLGQGMMLPVLYAICRRALRQVAGEPSQLLLLALVMAGLLSKVMFGQLGSLRNDWLGALVFLSAILVILPRDDQPIQLGHLAMAALGLGLVTGMKATNIVYVAAFAVMVPIAVTGWAMRGRALVVCAASGLAGLALLGGPWAIWLNATYGNPLFPMFNGWFEAPLGPSEPFRDLRYLPASLTEAFTRPLAGLTGIDVSNDYNFFDLRLALVMLAAPIVLLFSRHRSHVAIAAGLILALVFWTALFSIARYAIGFWAMAPLLTALAVASVFRSRMTTSPMTLTALAGCAALIISTDIGSVRRASWTGFVDPYVTASVPNATRFEGSLVLFAGQLPSAFLAPHFPESATFGHAATAVWSRTALKPYRAAVLQPLLAQHDKVYAVTVDHADHLQITAYALDREHHLTLDEAACERLHTSFDAAAVHWVVCPVHSTRERPQ